MSPQNHRGESSHPPWRILIMFISLILMILLLPAVDVLGELVSSLLLALVILSAINVAGDGRRSRMVGFSLGIPALLLSWLTKIDQSLFLVIAHYLFTSLLFVYVFALMMRKVFRSRVVNLGTILMAISCYILLGLLFVIVYVPMEAFDANSFSTDATMGKGELFAELHYYSYVTLTTLGYGDITPLSPLARSLAILEAATGALFLAVLIARLVSAYKLTQREDKLQ